MDKKDLEKIINDDELGLLKVKPRSSPSDQQGDRLISSFKEINDFVSKNDREPQSDAKDVLEFQLSSRLSSFRQDKVKAEKLLPFDEHGLLKNVKVVESVGDIFEDDDMGILDDGDNSIFKLRHVSKPATTPDFIAHRSPCKDFKNFEKQFMDCQSDITRGKRKLLPFAKEQQISEGHFFVLRGVLLYVDKVGEKENIKGKTNARLRCVFENGTESNMLLRSLARELYKDGRRVTESEEHLLDGLRGITDEDEESGYIYILKSQSSAKEIAGVANLYKVGFSTIPVEQRTKNASVDPTFLMAPVSIVSTYQCYNLNPQKLELLLHKFFGSACLDIDIKDLDGKVYRPREWFVAPLDVIEQAIYFILNGQIVDFRYDPEKKQIVGR